MRPIAASAAVVVLVALALAACGTSKEAQAKDKVCSARADISKQVGKLKGMSLSAAVTGQAKDSLSAIRKDLKQIADAQGDLKGERKRQVQDANRAFMDKVKSTASNIGAAGSIGGAASQLSSAFQDLAAAYQQTLAKIDCSS
jgi:Tfp pilus assembly protein PilP